MKAPYPHPGKLAPVSVHQPSMTPPYYPQLSTKENKRKRREAYNALLSPPTEGEQERRKHNRPEPPTILLSFSSPVACGDRGGSGSAGC